MKTIILASMLVSPIAAQEKPAQQQEPEKRPTQSQTSPSRQIGSAPGDLVKAAERARAQRRQAGEVPVYTNATLRRMEGGLVSHGRSATPPQTAQPQGETGPGQPGPQGESEQAGAEPSQEQALQELTRKISEKRLLYVTAVNKSQVLQLSMNDLNNKFLSQSDGAMQERLEQLLNERVQEIRDNQKEVTRLRGELNQLQSEARQAGMTPGELRRLIGQLPTPATIVGFPPDGDDEPPR